MQRGMLILGLIVFFLGACGKQQYPTPEFVVRQQLIAQGLPIASGEVQIVSTHIYGNKAIVLYQKSSAPRALFFEMATFDGATWSAECCDGGGSSFVNATPLVDYGGMISPFNGRITFGRRLAPEVHRVEGLFEEGSIVSEVVQGEYFGLYAPNELNLCELRVYDANDQLLQRSDHLGNLLDAPRTSCDNGSPGVLDMAFPTPTP